MNWLETILREAKAGGYKKLWLMLHLRENGEAAGEIRGEPPRQKNHWPLAWHLVKVAGVSWGCGNSDQHNLAVSAEQLTQVLPHKYHEARDKELDANDSLRMADRELDTAKAQVIGDALAAFYDTAEGKRLLELCVETYATCERTRKEREALEPVWLGGTQEFDLVKAN